MLPSVGDKTPQISFSWGFVLSQSTFHLVIKWWWWWWQSWCRGIVYGAQPITHKLLATPLAIYPAFSDQIISLSSTSSCYYMIVKQLSRNNCFTDCFWFPALHPQPSTDHWRRTIFTPVDGGAAPNRQPGPRAQPLHGASEERSTERSPRTLNSWYIGYSIAVSDLSYSGFCGY